MDAELVLLAMGFLGPVRNGLLEQLGVDLDARGNDKADEHYMSSIPGVFAAWSIVDGLGDCGRSQGG